MTGRLKSQAEAATRSVLLLAQSRHPDRVGKCPLSTDPQKASSGENTHLYHIQAPPEQSTCQPNLGYDKPRK
jgi:hypothetical protein